MISREQAERLAERYVDSICPEVPGGVALNREETIETLYGWVFFFNSKKFLETRDPLEALGGNSPILIESASGRITLLGTAQTVEESLRQLGKVRKGLEGSDN